MTGRGQRKKVKNKVANTRASDSGDDGEKTGGPHDATNARLSPKAAGDADADDIYLLHLLLLLPLLLLMLMPTRRTRLLES